MGRIPVTPSSLASYSGAKCIMKLQHRVSRPKPGLEAVWSFLRARPAAEPLRRACHFLLLLAANLIFSEQGTVEDCILRDRIMPCLACGAAVRISHTLVARNNVVFTGNTIKSRKIMIQTMRRNREFKRSTQGGGLSLVLSHLP